MAAFFYESLEEKSSRLFFVGYGCWVLSVDEVLEGQKLQYYIGLIKLIGVIGLIGRIGLIAIKG